MLEFMLLTGEMVIDSDGRHFPFYDSKSVGLTSSSVQIYMDIICGHICVYTLTLSALVLHKFIS